ncbi:Vms1/Ankzf1 family peptidyl-tRNA hydrolase [Kibdelosporangium persicum]|uniref:Peptide chain release factor 2 n=1 Tax=Kibdelosporangium persicum TaxID=2698649 RepID=A0ABX2FGL1_9PSEU|nr:Vms1/Ankzf1 family peptidyl-tRNA hydrolase [Kibdelosporangium persicum]NRN70417.1 Peptide chain release factor 2 [Kibdelosporangium persicum]
MDLRSLRHLLTVDGPFASAYFDSSHNTEDAARISELRWRELREQLREQGIDESTLDAMDTAVPGGEPPVGPAGRALVAAGGQVLVDEVLPEPPLSPVTRVSPLPYLLPLTTLPGKGAAHIIVVVDSAGADLRVVDEHGDEARTETVTGREHPLHKVRGGGWAHLRFQHTVEETIRRNIQDVADEITRLTDQLDVGLIVLAGEVQARSGLHRRLPPRCQQIAVETESGGRAGGSDHAALEQEVRRLVDQRTTRHVPDRDPALTVTGLPKCVAAIREANVDTLLLVTSQIQDLAVWMGTEPSQVAVHEEELRGLGMPSITQCRADEALPWAALAVGADVVTVEDELTDGVSALLRHT